MRKWAGGCKDNRTGMEILFSELGYNEACAIVDKWQTVYGGVQDVKMDNLKHRVIISTVERIFLYDEDRELLLGD